MLTEPKLTELRQIHHPKGDIFHALKASEESFSGFGEAYFSTINHGDIKGWKQHTKMLMNLVVIQGAVEFYVREPDGENLRTYLIGPDVNYSRITIPPRYWVAFKGIGENASTLLNLASIEHDPTEANNVELSTYATV